MGTGLSLFMNTLAGALPGGDHSADVAIGHRGQFLLVISPDLFGEADVFEAAIDEIWRQVKATEPLPGVDEVLAPGEQEQRTFEAAQRQRRNRLPRVNRPRPPAALSGARYPAGCVVPGWTRRRWTWGVIAALVLVILILQVTGDDAGQEAEPSEGPVAPQQDELPHEQPEPDALPFAEDAAAAASTPGGRGV